MLCKTCLIETLSAPMQHVIRCSVCETLFGKISHIPEPTHVHACFLSSDKAVAFLHGSRLHTQTLLMCLWICVKVLSAAVRYDSDDV